MRAPSSDHVSGRLFTLAAALSAVAVGSSCSLDYVPVTTCPEDAE
jgi:hypothetical protein